MKNIFWRCQRIAQTILRHLQKTVLYNNRAAISNSAYHDVAANYLDSGFVRRCITHPTRPNLVYNTEISPTRSIFIRLRQPIRNIQHRSCNVWKCVEKHTDGTGFPLVTSVKPRQPSNANTTRCRCYRQSSSSCFANRQI